MRLREPLNGFRMASGHAMFHIAFFIGSYIAVRVDSSYYEIFNIGSHLSNSRKDMPPLVFMIRVVHLVIAATQFMNAYLESRGHLVVGRLLSCLQIFLYQGMVLFEQYKLLKYDGTNANE